MSGRVPHEQPQLLRRAGGIAAAVGAFVVVTTVLAGCAASDPKQIKVGSKKFTENVILGEAAVQLARGAGAQATHQAELGGTRVLFEAVKRGDLDVYPEYTGTLAKELLPEALKDAQPLTLEAIRAALKPLGLGAAPPLAFNNTYGIAARPKVAERLRLTRISELKNHPELNTAFGHEFLDREDGWPGLRAAYELPQEPAGLDHDLAYRGMASGEIDIMDAYTTDAEIAEHNLVVLDDDKQFFPEYRALFVYRLDLHERAPDVVTALDVLAGKITSAEMSRFNGMAKLKRRPTAEVAAALLSSIGVAAVAGNAGPTRSEELLGWIGEHLVLVGISLFFAILLAIPVGILAARHRRLGQVLLAVTGVLQTVPSLALLVFIIPLVGIGAPGAIVALFLYSLLPIVRNTHAGLVGIAPGLARSADALGLRPLTRLRRVELPLALPSILAGIKTAAVINVGTATLGALIGAGGLGKPILTGIRLADEGLILTGAVPAALLALAAQGLFELVERLTVPEPLRGSRAE